MHSLRKIIAFGLYVYVLYMSYTQSNLLYTVCISLISIGFWSLLTLDHKITIEEYYYEIIPGEEKILEEENSDGLE